MRKLATTLVLIAAAVAPALAADVGVSVSISQPGVYGRVDIGRFPQPQVVLAQPVIITRPVVVVEAPQPVYLWVPPGHRQNWRRYCGQYNACGTPVYFVRDEWYGRTVRPHEHERDDERGRGERGERGDDRDGDRDDGKGKGKGKGHGKGHWKDKHD